MKSTSELISDYLKKQEVELPHGELTKLADQIDLAGISIKGLKTSIDVDKFLKSKLGQDWQTDLIKVIEEEKKKEEIILQQFIEQQNLEALNKRAAEEEEEQEKERQIQQQQEAAQNIENILLKEKLQHEPVKASETSPTIDIMPKVILLKKLTTANESIAQKKETYKNQRVSYHKMNGFAAEADKYEPQQQLELVKKEKDSLILAQEKLRSQLNNPDDEQQKNLQKQYDINQKNINVYVKLEGVLEGRLKMYDLKGEETNSIKKAYYFVSNDMQLSKDGNDFLLLNKNQDVRLLTPEEKIAGLKAFDSQKESICHDTKYAEKLRKEDMGKDYRERNAIGNAIENKEKNKSIEQEAEGAVDFSFFDEPTEFVQQTPSPVTLSPIVDTITNINTMIIKNTEKYEKSANQRNNPTTEESKPQGPSVKTGK